MVNLALLAELFIDSHKTSVTRVARYTAACSFLEVQVIFCSCNKKNHQRVLWGEEVFALKMCITSKPADANSILLTVLPCQTNTFQSCVFFSEFNTYKNCFGRNTITFLSKQGKINTYIHTHIRKYTL